MKRAMTVLIVASAVAGAGCATKGFVREHVGAADARISETDARITATDARITATERSAGERIEAQGAQLRETAERTEANTQAIEAAGQIIRDLDARVSDASASATDAKDLAGEARQQAETVATALRETESRLSQRFTDRNRFHELETTAIYFDFDKAELRDDGINELEEVARALKADPDAVVELKGFADPRGPDRYNNRLTRERVDAVVRYLVQRHGIELRRIHAVGMGKAARAAGEKADREAFARSRRVDIRLLAPQS
jgi:outer membrane protein OmpA-like peptidoglycan-associated protein